jgi:hypothetical protein
MYPVYKKHLLHSGKEKEEPAGMKPIALGGGLDRWNG